MAQLDQPEKKQCLVLFIYFKYCTSPLSNTALANLDTYSWEMRCIDSIERHGVTQQKGGFMTHNHWPYAYECVLMLKLQQTSVCVIT